LYAFADLKHQPNLSEIRLDLGVIEDLLERISTSLADDLDTTTALAVLFKYATSLAPGMKLCAEDFDQLLGGLDDLLGLNLATRPDITPEQKQLIALRETAREAKDWAGADKLRNQLRKPNIEVSDTPNGPRWRRSNII